MHVNVLYAFRREGKEGRETWKGREGLSVAGEYLVEHGQPPGT